MVMKNINFLVRLFLIVAALTFYSCTTEPIDPAINLNDFGGNNNLASIFKVNFSGATWSATATNAIVSSNTIFINAMNSDGSTISILVQGIATGTYPTNTNIISYTPLGSSFGYWSVNNSSLTENTGSISITTIDTVNKKISGTFNYKGYWSDTATTSILPVQFTSGVFTNISY